MAFILRKLDRKASFYLPDWLDEDDAQADALSSLRTKDNRLSVWRIDDDRGNLRRVVAALAAGRDFLDKLDYAVIDRQALDSLGIRVIKADGSSPDDGANQRWHHDLNRLSGRRLVALAVRMRSGLARESKISVRALITESIHSGFIARSRLKASLLQSLELDPE